MRVYGHRGFPERCPENTVAGVVAALDVGAAGVEVDARRDSGGVLVCSHDPLSGAPVDRLDAVLDAARGRGRVIVEIKNMPGEPDFDAPVEATAHALVALLRARAGDDITASSFDWFAIEAVRASGIGVRTAFLSPPGVALGAALAYVADAGHDECHPHWTSVLETPELVATAGCDVVCWTVDDPDVARELAACGVAGVITNDPAALLAL